MSWRALHPRMQFAIVAVAGLIAFYGLGLFLAGPLIAAMRPVAEMLGQAFGLATSIDATAEGWRAHTGLHVITGGAADVRTADVVLPSETLHVLMRGAPLFVALMAAPPWTKKLAGRIALGLAVLLVVYALSTLAVVLGKRVVLVNHVTDPMGFPPPDYLVGAKPYGPFSFFLGSFFYYIAMMIWPIVGPVALWLVLKREAVSLLLRRETPAEPMAATKR